MKRSPKLRMSRPMVKNDNNKIKVSYKIFKDGAKIFHFFIIIIIKLKCFNVENFSEKFSQHSRTFNVLNSVELKWVNCAKNVPKSRPQGQFNLKIRIKGQLIVFPYWLVINNSSSAVILFVSRF